MGSQRLAPRDRVSPSLSDTSPSPACVTSWAAPKTSCKPQSAWTRAIIDDRRANVGLLRAFQRIVDPSGSCSDRAHCTHIWHGTVVHLTDSVVADGLRPRGGPGGRLANHFVGDCPAQWDCRVLDYAGQRAVGLQQRGLFLHRCQRSPVNRVRAPSVDLLRARGGLQACARRRSPAWS